MYLKKKRARYCVVVYSILSDLSLGRPMLARERRTIAQTQASPRSFRRPAFSRSNNTLSLSFTGHSFILGSRFCGKRAFLALFV